MKPRSILSLLAVFLLSLLYCNVSAQIYYSRQSGSWNNPDTWSTVSHTGAAATDVPGETGSNHTVIIAEEHVIDYNVSTTISSLFIGTGFAGESGYLRFPFSDHTDGVNTLANDYDLTVTGNVQIASNGHLIAVQGGEENPTGNTMNGTATDRDDHNIFIGGNLSNAGTIDLENDINTSYEVELHFIGTSNQTISGSGIWDTYNITYNNTGTLPINQITNRSVNFTASVDAGRSTFTQGTYVHDNTGTYSNQDDSNVTYTNVSFIITDGTFNMVVNHSSDHTVAIEDGSITVDGGQFNSGSNSTFGTNLTIESTGTFSVEDGGVATIGNSSSNSGTLNLQGNGVSGASASISDAASVLTVYSKISLFQNSSFTQNNGTLNVAPNSLVNTDGIDLQGNAATFTMNDGNLNVLSSVEAAANAIRFIGEGGSVDFLGGTAVLGNETGFNEGRIYFENATDAGTLTIDGASTIITLYEGFVRANDALANVTVSNGAQLSVAPDSDDTGDTPAVSEIRGTFTISESSSATFGNGIDVGVVSISGTASLEVNTKFVDGSSIYGAFAQSSSTSQSTFNDEVAIETGGSLTLNDGTIDMVPDLTTATSSELLIRGDLITNGGTINLGASVTSVTSGDLVQVYDGGTLSINAGTFSILANASLASIADQNPLNIENNDAGEDATAGDGTVTIGDGSGGSNTAQLIIAPNLAAQSPSPSSRSILDMDGANSVLTINSDGYLSVGGGNIGDLRLNSGGANFVMNGGTCDITASLELNDGTSAEINSGTLNIGTSASNGINSIIYSDDPSDITSLTLNGGIINVGDGNSLLAIGDDDGTPSFGSTTAYSILEITGGTLNLNGAFNLDDANARFTMSGGRINLNPQGDQNLGSDISIFDLEQGIVDMNNGTVTVLNPHAATGAGYALNINASGNGDNLVSGSAASPTAITFGSTFRLGDGVASLDGSEDGFDLSLSDDHTYSSFIINNPAGSNRQVEIVNDGNTYSLNNNLIVSADTLDIGTNVINSSGSGVLSLAANSYLMIGNTNNADHFPGNASPFSTYSIDAASTVKYDGGGDALVSLSGGAQFGNLIISGSGTKTLNTTETVRSTLTLEDGTFASGTNLTLSTDATILRTDGVMTGTIQGTNAYNLSYEGTSKTSQAAEWSGSGEKSLIVNLDADETLDLHADLTAQGSLTITEGILHDNNFTLTVGSNISNSSLHTGTGKIYLAGSSAQRTIGGDGTGQFQNLELDDTNGASFAVSQTINGTLTLSSGVLDIDNYLLTLPTTASVSAASPSATTMIQVNAGVGAAGVQKAYAGSGAESFTWPVGSNGKYTPATVEVVSATSGGTVTINPVDAENPFTTDDADLALDYYWIISKSGLGSETANLSFTYDQTDATGGDESAYVPARYASGTWTNINDASLVDEAANTISFNSVPYVDGQFTAAEPSEFGATLTYYSRADGNWSTASSWSTDELGGAAASTVPGSDDLVVIGNNNTITISSNDITVSDVELQSTGTLVIGDATTGHNLGTVSGEGVLSVETNDSDATEFPDGSYTDLLGAAGGTVEYTGTGSYTALSTPSAFRHLTISGSGTVTLPDAELSVVEDLTIGETSTALLSNATSGDLSIGGDLIIDNASATLQFQSGTNRSLTVTGDLINSGTLQVSLGGFATHNVFISGSITNNGTLDLVNATGLHRANVTFNSPANTSIAGTGGTTDFYRIIVNKGTTASSELDITATNFTLNAPTNTAEKALEIRNGTLKLSAPHSITLSTGGGSFAIPSSGGLWLNDAGATAEITSASSNLSLAGLLRITDGTLTIGDDLTGIDENSIAYSSGNATITVEGGALTVGGSIRPNPDAATLSYSQSGGTVTVANNRSSSEDIGDNSEADFAIETGSGSSFTMSDGLLEIVRRNATADGKAIRINSGISHTVTGGTVRILNSSTATSFNVGIASAAPFWNLEIGNGNSFSEDVGAPSGGIQGLTVLNDLTINMVGGTFKLYQANVSDDTQGSMNLDLGGSFTLTNGSFESGNPSVVTFNGSGLSGQTSPQVISGSPTFYSVNINNTDGAGSVQLANAIGVEGNWTYTTGTIDQNSQLITFNGTTNQVISGSPFSLDDVTIDNASGITQGVTQLTVTGTLNLDNGVLAVGDNSLVLGETATVASTGTFGTGTMIQTSGSESAAGVQKAYSSSGGAFTFPIGTDVYSPATINVTDADGSSGTVTVNPVNSRDVTAPATTSLNYQWFGNTSGFGANVDISHSYTYDDTDIDGTEADYLDAYFDGISWTQGNTTNVDEATNTISLTTTGSIDDYQFTAGDGFADPTVYYSVASADWDVANTWNTASDGSGTNGIPTSTSPIIVQTGNTVTIPASTAVAAASTTVENGGELVIEETDDTNYPIGTVSGAGTLRFSVGATPDVPTLDNSFVSASGGTVEYEFTPTTTNDVDLPSTQTAYNNLIIDHQGGAFEARLSADYTINGDLSVVSGRFDLLSFTCDRSTAGGTLTMASDAQLWMGGSNNFPGNFSTHTLDASSQQSFTADSDQTIDDLGGDAYGILHITGSGTRTLAGNITIGGDLYIDQEATLDLENNNVNIKGDWIRNTLAGSAFEPGTGTVTFSGASLQSISIDDNSTVNSEETFYDVVINNSSGVSLDDAGDDHVTQLNITNDLTFTDGTLELLNRPLTVSGNLTNNTASTTPIANSSVVSFDNTSSGQTVSGTTGVALGNITLAKASGTTLTLSAPVSVSGTLNMQNDGNLVLSGTANNLTFGSSATVSGSFSSNRMIVTGGSATSSQVIKQGDATADSYDFTFPIGVGSNYTPVTINATAVTASGGNLGVRSVDGAGSYSLIDGTRALDRHFTLDLSSITDITASFEFAYVDSDIEGDEINYLAWFYNGSLNEADNGVVNPGSNTFGSTDITVSDASTEWVAGEAGAFFDRLYSVADGDWSIAATWNTNPLGGGTAIVPSQFTEVEIQATHTITSSLDITVPALQLDGNLELTNSAAGYDLGVLTGTGQLTLNSGDFPGHDALGTTFFDNGTVEFTDDGPGTAYTLSADVLSFNDLIVSGERDKVLGGNITLAGDLTIDNVTLDADITNSYNISLGGDIVLLNGGALNTRSGTLALVGAVPQSVPSGIIFNNLLFGNAGTKSIGSTGAFSANDFRILSTSGSVGFSTGTDITLSGDWFNASASGAGVYSNVGSLILDNSSDQSIEGVNTFHNLNVSKTGSGHTVDISGTVTLDDGASGGDLTISTDDVVAGSADFNLLGDWTNNGSFSTSGTANFNGTLAQTVTGDNTFGSLVIDNTAGATFADDVTTTIAEDLTVTSGTLNTGGGTATVVFDGTGEQTINGAITFNNLTKQAGDTLTLSGSSTVNGTLTLTAGIINTTISDLLVIGADGSVSGGSGSSYVNGPLRHTENSVAADTKVYPFGSGTTYRPITLDLSQADATVRTYTGSLNESAPTERTLPLGLERVSGIRYYTITQAPSAAVSAATVSIDYNEDDLADVASTLRIAKSDGSNWVDLGGIGDTGDDIADTFESGTITSSNFTTFSDFALASSDEDNNPLPVELIDFQALSTSQGVRLFWTTATEINNSHFIVERSLDGLSFKPVARVNGAGDSPTPLYYEEVDEEAPFGTLYYRLQQIDFDGVFSYSPSIVVNHVPQQAKVSIQPNPIEDYRTTLSAIGFAANQTVTIRVVDLSGFQVREYYSTTNAEGNLVLVLTDLDVLNTGLYTVMVISDQFQYVEKLIVP